MNPCPVHHPKPPRKKHRQEILLDNSIKKYGLVTADYFHMLWDQGHRCAICKEVMGMPG